MIGRKDGEFSLGRMVGNMKGIGLMGSSMEGENIPTNEKRKKKENG